MSTKEGDDKIKELQRQYDADVPTRKETKNG